MAKYGVKFKMQSKGEQLTLQQINNARDELLDRVIEFFSKQKGVKGLLLVGSIPGGSADAYSDIDLRVIATPESHARLVNKRLEIPGNWGELLFNEWMDGTDVCVSYFRPFLKIDVIYWNMEALTPSAWFNLKSKVLLDHDGTLERFLEKCAAVEFERPGNQQVSQVLSKGLACAHECLRRTRRGELFYAQSMLERVRTYTVQIEDWLNEFEPADTTELKIEKRISPRLHAALVKAYPPLDATQIEESLLAICGLLKQQICDLHGSVILDRDLTKDLESVELIVNKKIDDSIQ